MARELREIAEDGIGRSPRPRATSGGWGEDAPAPGRGGHQRGRGCRGRGAQGEEHLAAAGWNVFADAPGGRARSHWDDDDDDDGAGDGIIAIPTLGDGDDGGGYGKGGAGAAPVYQQNRAQRLRGLDKEMVSRFGGSHRTMNLMTRARGVATGGSSRLFRRVPGLLREDLGRVPGRRVLGAG